MKSSTVSYLLVSIYLLITFHRKWPCVQKQNILSDLPQVTVADGTLRRMLPNNTSPVETSTIIAT